jgi:hypothetical protein
MQAWRGAPLASGEPLELAEEFLWGRKSRTVWWEEDMAVDGNYIRGNNKAVVWATEGKGIARESMSVCGRLGAWAGRLQPAGGFSLVCGVDPGVDPQTRSNESRISFQQCTR